MYTISRCLQRFLKIKIVKPKKKSNYQNKVPTHQTVNKESVLNNGVYYLHLQQSLQRPPLETQMWKMLNTAGKGTETHSDL